MTNHEQDRTHLARTLELALQGRLWVAPNPMVGCVIVKRGRLLAESYHRRFGGPHAEVLALKKAGAEARGSTLYVNLEPCSHQGKTPPCTQAIIRAGVKTVVACGQDPNRLVSGRGFRALRRAGIEVRTGTLREEASVVNEKFFWAHTRHKPFVAVKVAQTLDARTADYQSRSQWITSTSSRVRAHELRSEYDAVLVGATTVTMDDPALTVRLSKGRQPLRIVLDGRFQVHEKARIFRTSGGRVILLTSMAALHRNERKALMLEHAGTEVVGIGSRASIPLEHVLAYLAERGITSVLVEGGARTSSAFVRGGLAQQLYAFIAPALLGSGKAAISVGGKRLLRDVIRLADVEIEPCGTDVLISGRFSEQ
jgi:diaminohydroxyphosphoribosylaminopyrimidine deaminase / 5-amino-6-(5-phosphoribosylamino)uracil reductase